MSLFLKLAREGLYDAINIIDAPGRMVVCGVTSLDLDHTGILGDTLEEIAKGKRGIFLPEGHNL